MRFWDWLDTKEENAPVMGISIPDSEERIRQRIRFFGQVQGVGFRFTVQMAARDHLVTGWVKNEYDGSVTAEMQGYAKDIRHVVRDTQTHSRFIRIDRIENEEIPVDVHETDFKAY